MLDALEILGARAADHAADRVALVEQQLGQVTAVLAGDPRDECRFLCHACPQPWVVRGRFGLHWLGDRPEMPDMRCGGRYSTGHLTKSRRPSNETALWSF